MADPLEDARRAAANQAEQQPKNSRGRAAHLAAYQYKPGQSGNLAGRPPKRPLAKAMEALLNGDARAWNDLPEPMRVFVAAWYGMSLFDAAAAREVLLRIDGRVPHGAQRELPSMTVVMQQVQQMGAQPRQPVASPPEPLGKRPPITSENGRSQVTITVPRSPTPPSAASKVTVVEAVPIERDDEDEDEDSDDEGDD